MPVARTVLGLNGYHAPVLRHGDEWRTRWYHDASAVLVQNGRVVVAVEEERLTRKKHTGSFPSAAIASCLSQAGLRLHDLDAIAVGEHGGSEPYQDPDLTPGRIADALRASGLTTMDLTPRIHLVHHHVAHAMSAFLPSGFDEALVLTLDGFGDGIAGLVGSVRDGAFTELRRLSVDQSLGNFFAATLPYFGYHAFDEYKLMGLASFGNADRFAERVSQLYTLLPDGDFDFPARDRQALVRVLGPAGPPRRPGEPFGAHHRDLAASIQQAFGILVRHLLEHFAAETGHRNLCMAGGCAQNSAFNGTLAASGLFDAIFVQPASNDAGTALGAALSVADVDGPLRTRERIRSVRWGPRAPLTLAEAQAWSPLVEARKLDEVARETASILTNGHVVGWVQGRSEFGPRALGGRSILADPRRADSKTRINEVIKEREAFRPFAPAILAEDAPDWFVLSGAETSSDFMTFAVPVREERREAVPAITHVDGTARVQTVRREASPAFHDLLDAFGGLTGVPMLLNTSFNSSREPIVQTAADAITCLLTSRLEYLVVGDILLTKVPHDPTALLSLTPGLPAHVQLTVRGTRAGGREHELVRRPEHGRAISAALATWLVSGQLPDGEPARNELAHEVQDVWTERLITLEPREGM